MSEPNGASGEIAPSIEVKGLSYAFPDGSSGLRDVILDLPPGSRTLLIGGTSPLSICAAFETDGVTQPMVLAKRPSCAYSPANVSPRQAQSPSPVSIPSSTA